MKKRMTLIALLIVWATKSDAQTTIPDGQTNISCAVDSIRTNKLNISTGIGIDSGSDSVLMSGGYGYNSHYTLPNDNYDTLWTISRLSYIYKTRSTSPFAYTGAYLKPGDHPFIMEVKGTVLDGYYAAFLAGGACTMPTTSTVMSSNWISVYGDAGGQNGSIQNAEGDGYCYERCFYICQEDTLSFNFQVMADDVVDTVLVDNIKLYTTIMPTAPANYTCGTIVNINTTKVLAAGRHSIKIWTRDNAGGHLALNVYGHVQSSGVKKNIIRSKFDSRCDFTPTLLSVKSVANNNFNFSIAPNPSNGKFMIRTDQVRANGHLEIFDYSSKKIFEQSVLSASSEINLTATQGVYFVRFSSENGVAVQKLVID